MPASPTTYLNGSIQTLMSTELNALASGSLALGAEITLTSAGYLLGEIEFSGSFAASPTANTAVSLWFLRAIDGSSYEDGSSSLIPARSPDLVLPVNSGQTATRTTRTTILRPGKFKLLCLNDGTGQAMAASGNTIKLLPSTFQNG